MIYRYFTTKKSAEYFSQWMFLSEPQINSILDCYKDKDCFYSIQTYDKDKQNKSCPIYFDFDYEGAKEDATEMFYKIKEHFDIYPEIYNSGNKGYHIVIPISITDPKCERIAKYIASSLKPGKSWDESVYKSRTMWRIPNTVNTKSGNKKVLLNDNHVCDTSQLNRELMKKLVAEAKEYVHRKKETRICVVNTDWETQCTPCIEQLLYYQSPLGIRHNVRVLLARFFRNAGVELEQAINIMLQYPHHAERDDKVRQVFTSIYNSDTPPTFGCRDESILKNKCNKYLCVYYKEQVI